MILNSLLRATKGARHVFLVSGTPFTLWRIPEAVHILGMSEPAWKALESSGRKKERTPLARPFFPRAHYFQGPATQARNARVVLANMHGIWPRSPWC